jgi:hypothetical protein
MARKPKRPGKGGKKSVEALRHEEAKRRNIQKDTEQPLASRTSAGTATWTRSSCGG